MSESITVQKFVELTADIVSAYVSNNSVTSSNLPSLVDTVHSALMMTAGRQVDMSARALAPAVPVKKSITQDYIICLEDGKKFKSLKRHLHTAYNMSPEQYREKWGLPQDYPMVASNYAKQRSELAKRLGLGKQQPQAPASTRAANDARATKAKRTAAKTVDLSAKVAVPARKRRGNKTA